MNFAFLIKSALLLALLYGGFALLLSKETFHRFNRLALLTAMIASLVLPAIQLTMDKPSFLRFEEDAAQQTLEKTNLAVTSPTANKEVDSAYAQQQG